MSLHKRIPLVYCPTSLNPQAESSCLFPLPSSNFEKPLIRKLLINHLPQLICFHHQNSFPYQPYLAPFQKSSLPFHVIWELHFHLFLICIS